MTLSLPPPALMISAPPAPSMLSAPEPPMIVLAPDVPVMATPVDNSEALTFWKLAAATASPMVWSAPPRLTVAARGDREIHGGDAARSRQHQRVRSAAAVDRGFGAVVDHGVVAAAGRNRV